MTHRAAIFVKGSFAELQGASSETLDECLRVPHPRPEAFKAYRDKRWDGLVNLHQGTSFPAGLTLHVAQHLQSQGRDVALYHYRGRKLDLSKITPEYLPPVGKFKRLWTHQLEAVRALLREKRGTVKSPTGSGKTEMVAVIAHFLWSECNWRTLIVVPKKGIMRQTVKRLESYFDGAPQVGWVGDSERVEGDVMVGTIQTLQGWRPRRTKKNYFPSEPMLRELVRESEVLISDECHKSSAEGWFDLLMGSRAYRRYGFSGTPLKHEELDDMRLIGATGPVVFEVSAPELGEKKLIAKPKICMVMSDDVSGPEIDDAIKSAVKEGVEKSAYQAAYYEAVVNNEMHNRAVIRTVQWMVDRGRGTLLLCRRREHFELLAEMLEESGLAYEAVWGDTDNSDRDHAKGSLARGRAQVVLATTVWDEGEDLSGVGAVVLAEGVKALTNSLQRIGRGTRRDTEDVWCVDFVPTCHKTLCEHAAQRAEWYESEGYEVRLVEEWPDERDDDADLFPFPTWDEEELAATR